MCHARTTLELLVNDVVRAVQGPKASRCRVQGWRVLVERRNLNGWLSKLWPLFGSLL